MQPDEQHSGNQRQIFTVARLNSEVRRLLESQWGAVWLLGEISNFSAPGSGHWYFSLKDKDAQIRAAMFRGSNSRVKLRPANGMQVLVRGRLSLYEPRGDYQLIIDQLEPAGEGLLQQQYEALKRQLNAEGLFTAENKKPLPSPIRTLGIITSPTGAAIRDVLSVLKRRDPELRVIIYPTQVQGATAAEQIRQALATALNRNEIDALLLTRGGGSLEDMWCFNDETLARDIAAAHIPTISAVGHEVDFCIADFVADVRAATPSAAAELVSQDRSEYLRLLEQMKLRLQRSWQQYRQQQALHLQHIQRRLVPLNPQQRLQTKAQQLDEFNARLQRSLRRNLQNSMQQQTQLKQRLLRVSPAFRIEKESLLRAQLQQRSIKAITLHLNRANTRMQSNQQALGLVSPLQTLERGYTISFDEAGNIIRNAEQFQTGDQMRTRFANGEILSRIESIKPR
ncbi:exodeoxyribonuclease VII, large subunit [Idiomarina sp. A28L]|uniref:exodeoxyribonuclease VII large subunit n=1 Tax=Idiomarina sp. A28L TaxID=1036674 RepID=UPI0002138DFC|nr:exodeoxyribonuclease VII large subunit [Idiomarina sp. A28L]EGN74710.1 exodeoxyribonuclease VII, large subunit [Idiomarina sp. A28L]